MGLIALSLQNGSTKATKKRYFHVELVSNQKGVLMRIIHRYSALLIIALICHTSNTHAQEEFSLDLIFGQQNPFRGKSYPVVQWIRGGASYLIAESDTISRGRKLTEIDPRTGNGTDFVLGSEILVGTEPLKFTTYSVSIDNRQVLFGTPPPEKQYYSRLSPSGDLYLFDRETRSLKKITDLPHEIYNQKFSPDGSAIGYVYGNNVYVQEIENGRIIQVTNDGNENIINGRMDWVYEEEFGISDGFQFSPDGKRLMFWRFDQSEIPVFNMVDHATLRSDLLHMRYPKAGDPNSRVQVGIFSFSDATTLWVDLGGGDDFYIPRVQWTGRGDQLMYFKMNRLQTELEVRLFDPKSKRSRAIITEKDTTWIELPDKAYFLSEAGQFILTSERDGFNHLYAFEMNGQLVRQITRGNGTVYSVLALDQRKRVIYFSGSFGTPTERHIYSVKFDGKGLSQLSQNNRTHQASFGEKGRFWIGTSSNVSTPPQTALYDDTGRMIRLLEANPIEAIARYSVTIPEFFSFTTEDGVPLNGMLYKPSLIREGKKAPLLIYVYGGPGSQQVVNRWGGRNQLWFTHLNRHGIAVAVIDNRGTAGRGKAFERSVYKNLGHWEVHDQVQGVRHLARYSFIDTSRTGIWGWSYGGYMATMSILKANETFKCAVAVAPVTDWKFYDTIYTERFMQRPLDNPEGYRESSALTHSAKLKGKLLLIHGTTDDNVHWANTVQLSEEFVKANKQFETLFYVNRNHGISGGNATIHLYTAMTNFFLQHLLGE